MRVPNLSSTIAFYPREMEDQPPMGLVPVWNSITILAKGSVSSISGYPALLDVIVPYNKYIVKSMRATIDGDLFQYAITDKFVLGNNEYTRLVFDTEDYIELPPVTDVRGPITVHTQTNLVGFLKGDGFNVYADPNGGGSTPLPDNIEFSYYIDGKVSVILYSDGTSKTFGYNFDGTVDEIVWVRTNDTVVKTFTYNIDGTVDRIDIVVT